MPQTGAGEAIGPGQRDAEQIAPADLDQARARAEANDREYAAKTAGEKDRQDRELVER